jgi:Ankyrin repeats (many copies)
MTALDYACEHGYSNSSSNSDLIRYLVNSCGAAVNTQDDIESQTPVHRYENKKLLKYSFSNSDSDSIVIAIVYLH